MFNLFDIDKDGFLDAEEFQDGMTKLFAESFEDNLKLVYDLFDFDSDGKISKEDMRILLSHVPLANLLDYENTQNQNTDRNPKHKSGAY